MSTVWTNEPMHDAGNDCVLDVRSTNDLEFMTGPETGAPTTLATAIQPPPRASTGGRLVYRYFLTHALRRTQL